MSVWIVGGSRISFRLVSFRFSSASSRGIMVDAASGQWCIDVLWYDRWVVVLQCALLSLGQEERILETQMQAGRAAETIGGHGMQAVRGGLSTRRK